MIVNQDQQSWFLQLQQKIILAFRFHVIQQFYNQNECSNIKTVDMDILPWSQDKLEINGHKHKMYKWKKKKKGNIS